MYSYYLTYEYNASQQRSGTIAIDHVADSRADATAPFQLVLRYHEGEGWKVVAQSQPFAAPSVTIGSFSSSRVFVDFFEAGEAPRFLTAGIHAGFEIASSHEPSDYDWVALCAPGAPTDAYATYAYNAQGTAAAGGTSGMPAIKLEHNASGYYVLRYLAADGAVVAESDPFSYAPDGS